MEWLAPCGGRGPCCLPGVPKGVDEHGMCFMHKQARSAIMHAVGACRFKRAPARLVARQPPHGQQASSKGCHRAGPAGGWLPFAARNTPVL
mmetsp:Transcript_54978/g.176322  ORF Transcript_54978/g.176322 Transcript_54978/m.176322 type:complete len:91 (-) Transcript_54978:112-384(-)